MYRPQMYVEVTDIAYCNNCDQELGAIWEGADCPIKEKMICKHCHQPITLILCRIEQQTIQHRLL